MATDIISGLGGSIGQLFGSNAPPKAILHRAAAPTAKASGALSTELLKDVSGLSRGALDTFMGGQPKMQQLAGQQEQVLGNVLNQALTTQPSQFLGDIGRTAFSFIDPNVIAPLSRFDVNQDVLMRRARGLSPAATDSTAERLRNARIASQRFYDVAQQAYNALPNLYGQAIGQQQANQALAAGVVPQIAAAYEGVFSRPTQGILNRIGTVNAANLAGQTGIQNILGATQGYQQPRNFADRLAGASQEIGSGATGTLGTLASLYGGGGGGGGL